MTTNIIRRILLLVIASIWGCSHSVAMDLITLQNGIVLKGQIYQTDEDGALYMHLTDGTKRYIFPYEIDTKSSDEEPFLLDTERRNDTNSHKPGLFNIYMTYDLLLPTDTRLYGDNLSLYDKSSGVSVGFSSMIELNPQFIFNPGLELALNWIGHSSAVTRSESISHFNTRWTLNTRIPILLGYQSRLRGRTTLTFLTGPVIDLQISQYSNQFNTELQQDTFYYIGNVNNNTIIGEHLDFNRFNAYWRFAIKANLNRLQLGLSYSLGMTNRPKGLVRSRQDLFQVSVGYNF